MTDLTNADREAIEQQLDVLLDNVMEMETFPAGQILEFGLKLVRPRWLTLADRVTAQQIHVREGLQYASHCFGYSAHSGPFTWANGPWQECLKTAQAWYISRLTPEKALRDFEQMTSQEALEDPPAQLNLFFAVKCGLKMGLPREVICEEDQHSPRPIETVVRTCHRFFPIEIEVLSQAYLHGDDPGYIDVSTLKFDDCTFTVGPWLPLFQLIESWWKACSPILP